MDSAIYKKIQEMLDKPESDDTIYQYISNYISSNVLSDLDSDSLLNWVEDQLKQRKINKYESFGELGEDERKLIFESRLKEYLDNTDSFSIIDIMKQNFYTEYNPVDNSLLIKSLKTALDSGSLLQDGSKYVSKKYIVRMMNLKRELEKNILDKQSEITIKYLTFTKANQNEWANMYWDNLINKPETSWIWSNYQIAELYNLKKRCAQDIPDLDQTFNKIINNQYRKLDEIPQSLHKELRSIRSIAQGGIFRNGRYEPICFPDDWIAKASAYLKNLYYNIMKTYFPTIVNYDLLLQEKKELFREIPYSHLLRLPRLDFDCSLLTWNSSTPATGLFSRDKSNLNDKGYRINIHEFLLFWGIHFQREAGLEAIMHHEICHVIQQRYCDIRDIELSLINSKKILPYKSFFEIAKSIWFIHADDPVRTALFEEKMLTYQEIFNIIVKRNNLYYTNENDEKIPSFNKFNNVFGGHDWAFIDAAVKFGKFLKPDNSTDFSRCTEARKDTKEFLKWITALEYRVSKQSPSMLGQISCVPKESVPQLNASLTDVDFEE